MFGLYLHKDNVEKKIYIDTVENFYDRDKVTDITDLIDYSKDYIIKPLYNDTRFIKFKSNVKETLYSKTYKEEYGVDYGDKIIDTGSEFNTSTTISAPAPTHSSFAASAILNPVAGKM